METLTDRLNKAKEKVAKKTATIEKKLATIAKKEGEIAGRPKWMPEGPDGKRQLNPNTNGYGSDAYDLHCDVERLHEDIKRLRREIEATNLTIKKYEKQRDGELERESIFVREVPESWKLLQAQVVQSWNDYDINRRNTIKKNFNELGYNGYITKFGSKRAGVDYDYQFKSDEQIVFENEKAGKYYVLDLYLRVRNITGEITDWSRLRVDIDGRALNGTITGKEGIATVQTIVAGGHNIQRLHLRVLVHSK